jgi:hypothetical protein
MFMPYDLGCLAKAGQIRLGNPRAAADVGTRATRRNGMSKADAAAVERIIANKINATARGDADALATRIVTALGEAGYRIVEDTAHGSQPDKFGMEQLYRSPNGDTWFLARDPTTGSVFVRHQANASSGGQVCESAWNKDPVFGVIGIQSGPPGRRVHSGFRGGCGGQVGECW